MQTLFMYEYPYQFFGNSGLNRECLKGPSACLRVPDTAWRKISKLLIVTKAIVQARLFQKP